MPVYKSLCIVPPLNLLRHNQKPAGEHLITARQRKINQPDKRKDLGSRQKNRYDFLFHLISSLDYYDVSSSALFDVIIIAFFFSQKQISIFQKGGIFFNKSNRKREWRRIWGYRCSFRNLGACIQCIQMLN